MKRAALAGIAGMGLAGALGVAAWGGAMSPAASAPAPGPAATPASGPAAAPAEETLRGLLGALGSGDYAEREEAQRALETLDYHALPALRRAAADAPDAEIKARLAKRVAQLEEQVALDPPPVSVSLRQATWAQTIEHLNAALGVPKLSGYGRDQQITLDVREKPFWEVIAALCDQQPVKIDSGFHGISLEPDAKEAVRQFHHRGPYLAAPLRVERTSTARYQPATAPATSELTFHFLVAVDPRVLVARAAPPVLTSVVDDKGHELVIPPEKNAWIFHRGGESVWKEKARLAAPAGLGSRILSAKGKFEPEVATATAEMTLDAPAAREGQAFAFAGQNITIVKWKPREGDAGYIDCDFKVEVPKEPEARGEGDERRIAPTFFRLIGADGATLGEYVRLTDSSLGSHFSGKAPVKLKIIVATKTKLVDVPFEFTNLPLP